MSVFRIAAAQTGSVKGDIPANVVIHAAMAEQAGRLGVTYLFFPELGLTGYEPELAAELAMMPDDTRLAPLRNAAQKHGMIIVAGAPLRADSASLQGDGASSRADDLPNKPRIGSFIFRPDGSIGVYAKIHLHSTEEAHFSAGSEHVLEPCHGEQVGVTICADLSNPAHAATYKAMGATIYAASVLVSENGYAADAAILADRAKEHGLLVLMSNHNKPSGGWNSGGRSAIWTPDGQYHAAGAKEDALVMAERDGDGWKITVEVMAPLP